MNRFDPFDPTQQGFGGSDPRLNPPFEQPPLDPYLNPPLQPLPQVPPTLPLNPSPQLLPDAIGRPLLGQNDGLLGFDPNGLSNLYDRSFDFLIEALEKYVVSGGLGATAGSGQERRVEVAEIHVDLTSQFPFSTIAALPEDPEELETILHIGNIVNDVVCVVADFEKFSALASAAPSELLAKEMNDFYDDVRRLIWDHGGVLHTFLGDGVSAVFGYPGSARPDPARDALAFAIALIERGKALLEALQVRWARFSQGLRVGIASGEVVPSNISNRSVHLSFLGSALFQAKHLEAESTPDQINGSAAYWRRSEGPSAEGFTDILTLNGGEIGDAIVPVQQARSLLQSWSGGGY